MIKICIAQQNYIIGDINGNVAKIIAAVQTAASAKADLIVFPELAVCGYAPQDLLDYPSFVKACFNAVEKIAEVSHNIAIIVGAPAFNVGLTGKNLFNSAYFLSEGKIQQIAHKALLPAYDIFDERRHFEPGFDYQCIQWKGLKIALTVCEDIWDMDVDPDHTFRPIDILSTEQPDFMINISASPFNYFQHEQRAYVFSKNTALYQLPILNCNTVGAQTSTIFDGRSTVCNANGEIVCQLPSFEEALSFVSWENGQFIAEEYKNKLSLPTDNPRTNYYQANKNIELIHQALVFGLREYFSKMSFEKAIVMSSGGLDSAVVLALACEALGSKNVHALLMPSQFSTDHSVDDAVALSKNLNNPYNIIAIKDIYDSVEKSLHPVFGALPFDVTEENIQSRIRGMLVMAMANKHEFILLNTSNKSELATGYGTLYGDMAGGLSVIGDLYKTQVYALANYINRNQEIIPEHIISKLPSAELRPDQKDSDSLPDYPFLDKVLYQHIEQKKSPEEIIAFGWDAQEVKRILGMLNRSEFKRQQFCPILRISSRAFGSGRRMPIVARY